jgi:hypothetical protein
MLLRSNNSGRILIITRTNRIAKTLTTVFGERYIYIGLRMFSVNEAVRLLLRISEISYDRLELEEY